MPLYFMLHEAQRFHGMIQPAVAACVAQGSFAPVLSVCRDLLPAVAAFQSKYFTTTDEPLLRSVLRGLPFDRESLRQLISEVLLFGADDIPEFETAPATLCCLLAEHPALSRDAYSSIEQAHYGSRDLTFGSFCYRPEHAGFNGVDDVARLADYLGSIDTSRWTVADLAALTDLQSDEECAAELDFVREWLPSLVSMYGKARMNQQMIVCEIL